MKRIPFYIAISIIMTSCGWNRIGTLTMISTRNIESKIEYKLIKKGIEGQAKIKHTDAFQEAVENAVNQDQEAEFMKNVVVYIKSNGKKIKIVGDLWGVPSVEKNITQKVTLNVDFQIGDRVAFQDNNGKPIEGNIIGINGESALVEYETTNAFNSKKQKKNYFDFKNLTKLQAVSNSTTTPITTNTSPVEKPVSKPAPQKDLYKTTSEVNMRAGAGVNYSKIMTINKNESVEVVNKSNHEWWQIIYHDEIGFVSSKLLSK